MRLYHYPITEHFCNFVNKTIERTENRTMATITLKYDSENVVVKKLIEAMIALGATVVQPKGKPSKSGLEQSMDDIKNSRITTHKSVEDYFSKNKLDCNISRKTKKFRADYYAKEIDKEMDALWKAGKMTMEKNKRIAHTHLRTPYKK